MMEFLAVTQPWITAAVWLVFFLQLWSIWNTRRYHRRWDAQEKASMERWMRELAELERGRQQLHRDRAAFRIEQAKARGDLPPDFEGRIH
jgi:hypothetical protein